MVEFKSGFTIILAGECTHTNITYMIIPKPLVLLTGMFISEVEYDIGCKFKILINLHLHLELLVPNGVLAWL